MTQKRREFLRIVGGAAVSLSGSVRALGRTHILNPSGSVPPLYGHDRLQPEWKAQGEILNHDPTRLDEMVIAI